MCGWAKYSLVRLQEVIHSVCSPSGLQTTWLQVLVASTPDSLGSCNWIWCNLWEDMPLHTTPALNYSTWICLMRCLVILTAFWNIYLRGSANAIFTVIDKCSEIMQNVDWCFPARSPCHTKGKCGFSGQFENSAFSEEIITAELHKICMHKICKYREKEKKYFYKY